MLGAIAGDIIGSVYEARPIKSKDFPLFSAQSVFTDDTVCTVAVADCLLGRGDFADVLRRYVRKYPRRGYGGMFLRWAMTDGMAAYGSWGNGSAMRVSSVGHVGRDESDVLDLAARSSAVSHDHADAVAAAQATALAVWMAFRGAAAADIREHLSGRFGYDLGGSVDSIRPGYGFDVSASGSVPQSIVCALQSSDYEDAVRNAVSLGGDADTMACIAGAIAEGLHGIPADIAADAEARLDPNLGLPEEVSAEADGYFAGSLMEVVARLAAHKTD